jgi:hypothetical protein
MKGEHYVKLYDNLPRSSVNLTALPVRWLWAIMLTQANRHGLVYGTVESLAALANLSLEDTRKALEVLTSPDSASSNKAEEGRRILPRPGNRWFVVNYYLYLAKNAVEERKAIERAAAREKKRRQRARKRVQKGDTGGTPICNPNESKTCDPLAVAVAKGLKTLDTTTVCPARAPFEAPPRDTNDDDNDKDHDHDKKTSPEGKASPSVADLVAEILAASTALPQGHRRKATAIAELFLSEEAAIPTDYALTDLARKAHIPRSTFPSREVMIQAAHNGAP